MDYFHLFESYINHKQTLQLQMSNGQVDTIWPKDVFIDQRGLVFKVFSEKSQNIRDLLLTEIDRIDGKSIEKLVEDLDAKE